MSGKVVVVTGANQGLGKGLVKVLAKSLERDDVVYLTARDMVKGEAAKESLGETAAKVKVVQLDVTDTESIAKLASELKESVGTIDTFISNAAARMPADKEPATYARSVFETNNLGTRRVLDAFLPLTRERFLIVASSFGTLKHLDPSLWPIFDTDSQSMDDIDRALERYICSIERGKRLANWPEWLNVPSKVHQVALGRIAARDSKARVNSVCPGLVDTEASRPWFKDMSTAQSPDDAASHIVRLALLPIDHQDQPPTGTLCRFGNVLPWKPSP